MTIDGCKRVDQPAGCVVEANRDADPFWLATADPPRGEQGPVDLLFDVARTVREVFTRRREANRAAAGRGEPGPGAAFGLGESMACGRRAEVQASRRIAQPAHLSQCRQQLQMRTI